MRPSPFLSVAAAAALVTAVAGPASAATSSPASPARGLASSGVTLVGLSAGGHVITAGTLALLSDTLTANPVAQVVVTPLTVDGTAYGRQTVTPASGPASAPALDTAAVAPSALSGIVALRSPVLRTAASNPEGGASTEAGTSSLGGATLLGLPVALNGSLDVGSVVSKAGSLSQQSVTVTDVALPSIADLLAALGLDVVKLPTSVLVQLLSELDLTTTAVTTANKALDDAQALIKTQTDAATAEVNRQLAAVAAATTNLAAKTAAADALSTQLLRDNAARAAANQAVTGATAALASRQATATTAGTTYATLKAAYDATPTVLQPPLLPALNLAKTALDEATALVTQAQTAVTTTTAAAAAATTTTELTAVALTAARSAVTLAQSVLAAANGLLDAAQSALASIVKVLQPLIDQLLAAVVAVLDTTPLVSLDGLTVVSRASATSAKAGDQRATVVGGEVAGLRVLGTDVLSNVLGTTKVDLAGITAAQLASVNALVGQLTGTLSSVLSSVPGFPTLSVPAPTVTLLTKSVRTGSSGGFGTAGTDLRALTVTVPGLSVPTALAVPGAASLPALGGVTQVAGLLTSAPVSLELANLGNSVRFSPATLATGTPTTGTPNSPTTGTPNSENPGTGVTQLPRTGANQALALVGVALLAAAIAVRRRRTLEV